jgi:(p)ppGpp synthase/HD superfamily hydrolase
MTSLPRALELAENAHRNETRKNGITPYLAHPLSVASLVLRFGGNADQATAALLHDTVGRPGVTLETIREQFGETIAAWVDAFSDPPLSPDFPAEYLEKHPWEASKKSYLSKLATLSAEALLVVGCEEFDELLELSQELRVSPPAQVWATRGAHPMNHCWYYKEILKVLTPRLTTREGRMLITEFASVLKALQARVFEGA